ncbi:MAG: DMT family transporter [Pseudomonadota bacterium]
MILSLVAASGMTFAVRFASADMTASMIVFARSIGGLALALLFLAAFAGRVRPLRFTRLGRHALRGALVGVSTQLGFYTISVMPLAQATVLFFTAPIFAALLAVPLQGERIGLRRALAIAAGFAGVLVVVRPGAVAIDLPALSALGSSFLFALVLLMSRGLADEDGPLSAYVSSTIMTLIVTAPFAAASWSLPTAAWGWAALAAVVAFSMARNIADLQAYRLAEASVLAPIAYTRLVLIAVGAYALFDETPDVYTLIGGAVIVAAALYIAHRERLARRAA